MVVGCSTYRLILSGAGIPWRRRNIWYCRCRDHRGDLRPAGERRLPALVVESAGRVHSPRYRHVHHHWRDGGMTPEENKEAPPAPTPSAPPAIAAQTTNEARGVVTQDPA